MIVSNLLEIAPSKLCQVLWPCSVFSQVNVWHGIETWKIDQLMCGTSSPIGWVLHKVSTFVYNADVYLYVYGDARKRALEKWSIQINRRKLCAHSVNLKFTTLDIFLKLYHLYRHTQKEHSEIRIYYVELFLGSDKPTKERNIPNGGELRCRYYDFTHMLHLLSNSAGYLKGRWGLWNPTARKKGWWRWLAE